MNDKGFTLIELIVVIVILGILAVTAVPKYINLKADAQTSTLYGVKAAMEGASALVYGKSIVKGNQSLPASNNPKPTITLTDGTTLDIGYGYPIVPPPIPGLGDPVAYWTNLLDLSDSYAVRVATNGALLVYLTGMDIPTDVSDPCIAIYQAPTNALEKPDIQVRKCL